MNKAWSAKVVRQFQPCIADLLLNAWAGGDVLCLGQGSFDWFGVNAPKSVAVHREEIYERIKREEQGLGGGNANGNGQSSKHEPDESYDDQK